MNLFSDPTITVLNFSKIFFCEIVVVINYQVHFTDWHQTQRSVHTLRW